MVQDKVAVNILRETKSVCPQCLSNIPAFVIERGGVVYFNKHCKDHGEFEIEISKNPPLRYISDKDKILPVLVTPNKRENVNGTL